MSARTLTHVGVLLATLCMIAIAQAAFHGFPHSADEYVYLYQARTLQEGRLTNPPLPSPVFQTAHVLAEPDRSYGQYPPGWPALLAVGDALGVALATNALVTALALLLATLLARRVLGEREAWVAAALLATSPFVLLHGASLYSHPLVALLVLCLAWCLWRYAERPSAAPLVGVAAALAGVLLVRPFDAAITAVAVAPFALALLARDPRATTRDALVALPVLAAGIGLYLLYNAATTGDPFTPGHLRQVRGDAVDRPSLLAFRYWQPTLRRVREYALVGFPIALFPLAVGALWRRAPRGALLFGAVLVTAFWVAYASYPVDPPPRLGPRYLYVTHWFVALALAGGLVAVVGARWIAPLCATIAAVQLLTTGLIAVELRTLLGAGRGVQVAAAALEGALGEGAVVVLAGPSGSVPPYDLTRNDLDFAGPTLFALAPPADPGDRRVYYWDGIGGAPVLWTPDPDAPVTQVAALGDRAAVMRGDGGDAPWSAVFGASDCQPFPYLGLLWQGLNPPDRLSDVQRPYDVRFGPCPGFLQVRRVAEVGIPAALPRRLALYAHFRALLTARTPGDYRFELTGGEHAILRVGGAVVAEANGGETRGAALRLPPGTWPISVSLATGFTPPLLHLGIAGPDAEGGGYALSTTTPPGSTFHPRLPPAPHRP